jgi:hypothetical protein
MVLEIDYSARRLVLGPSIHSPDRDLEGKICQQNPGT